MELLQIAEGLQDESIHAALGQPSRLAGEMGDCLASGCRPPGLDPDAERADRAQHQRPAPSGPVGQPRGRTVDLLGALLQPEARELHRVRAEGVGLDDLGPGPHVRLMHLLH
jgi:hypothetical protein